MIKRRFNQSKHRRATHIVRNNIYTTAAYNITYYNKTIRRYKHLKHGGIETRKQTQLGSGSGSRQGSR